MNKGEKNFMELLTVAGWVDGNQWHRPLWTFEFCFLLDQFHINCLARISTMISVTMRLLNTLQARSRAPKLVNSTDDINFGRQ